MDALGDIMFWKGSVRLGVGLLMVAHASHIIAADETAYPPMEYDRVERITLPIAALKSTADVYYPTSETVSNAEPLPLAVFLQGFNVAKEHYSQFAATVARHGFVVVAPDCPLSVGPVTLLAPRAEHIDRVVEQVAIENLAAASPLFGRVDPSTVVLLGHSLGGGVGLQAVCNAAQTSDRAYRIAAAAFAAPFLPAVTHSMPSQPVDPLATGGIPVLILQGTEDGINDPELSVAAYDSLQDVPKALALVDGANHYGLADENNPQGAPRDVSAPTLDQSQAMQAFACWTGEWLRSIVYNDAAALDFVATAGTATDAVVACQAAFQADEAEASVTPMLTETSTNEAKTTRRPLRRWAGADGLLRR